MATILVRKLLNGDPQRGNGLSNFSADAEAVAITISERLQLLQGSWWENTSEGLPLLQSLLGQSTTMQAVALILRQRILGSPYVASIQSMSVTYNPTGRVYAFIATVNTAFGTITLTNAPSPSGGGSNVIGSDVTWQSLTGSTWSSYSGTQWQ